MHGFSIKNYCKSNQVICHYIVIANHLKTRIIRYFIPAKHYFSPKLLYAFILIYNNAKCFRLK